jgi:hypothetical protein
MCLFGSIYFSDRDSFTVWFEMETAEKLSHHLMCAACINKKIYDACIAERTFAGFEINLDL